MPTSYDLRPGLKYAYATETAVRAAFWRVHTNEDRKPREYRGKRQNDLPADVRTAFCEYVDYLQKGGTISERLAERVTL